MAESKQVKLEAPLKLAGLGRYVPPKVVTSEELERMSGWESGWCRRELGVTERRWADLESPSHMGAKAAEEAIRNAGLSPEDVDLIVSASSTASLERILPDGGALVQKQLGLSDSGIPCFSLHANCLSFLQALDMCAGLLASGRYETILVVSSEILSKNLDNQSRYVAGLFGDGAAAAVLTLPEPGEGAGLRRFHMRTYGRHHDAFSSRIGMEAIRERDSSQQDVCLRMDFEDVVKNGLNYIQQFLKDFLSNGEEELNRLRLMIPQPLGAGFVGQLARETGLPADHCLSVLDRFGFCSAASMPMALYEAVDTGAVSRGDQLLLLGAGAGLAVGGAVLKY